MPQVTQILHRLTTSAMQINKANYIYNGVGNRRGWEGGKVTTVTDPYNFLAMSYDQANTAIKPYWTWISDSCIRCYRPYD